MENVAVIMSSSPVTAQRGMKTFIMGKYSSIDKHCVNFKLVNLETFLIKYGEHTATDKIVIFFDTLMLHLQTVQ